MLAPESPSGRVSRGAFLRLSCESPPRRALAEDPHPPAPTPIPPSGRQLLRTASAAKKARKGAEQLRRSDPGFQNRVDGTYDKLVPGPANFTPNWGKESFLKFCRRPGSVLDYCVTVGSPAGADRRAVSTVPPEPRGPLPAHQPRRPQTAKGRRPDRAAAATVPPRPATSAATRMLADADIELPVPSPAAPARPAPPQSTTPVQVGCRMPSGAPRSRGRVPSATPLPSTSGVETGNRRVAAGLYEHLLEGFDREAQCFQSVELCCEAALEQARNAAGDERPHPLLTGVAALLLTKVASLFGRYQPLMERLLSIVLEAVYVDFSNPVPKTCSLSMIRGRYVSDDATTLASSPAAGTTADPALGPRMHTQFSESPSPCKTPSPRRGTLPGPPLSTSRLLDGRRFLRLSMFSESYKWIDKHFIASENRSLQLQRTQARTGQVLGRIVTRWQVFACRRYFLGWSAVASQSRLQADRLVAFRQGQVTRRQKETFFLRWKVYTLVSQRRAFSHQVQQSSKMLQQSMETLRGEVSTKDRELQKLRAERQRRQRKLDELAKLVDEERDDSTKTRQRTRELDAMLSNLAELAHTALDEGEALTDSLSRPLAAGLEEAGHVELRKSGRAKAQLVSPGAADSATAATGQISVRDVDNVLLQWVQTLAPTARVPQTLGAVDFSDGRQLLVLASRVAGVQVPSERTSMTDAERAQAAIDLMRESGTHVGLAVGDILRPQSRRLITATLCALFHRYAIYNHSLTPQSTRPIQKVADRTQEIEGIVRRLERFRNTVRDGERWQRLGWAVAQYGRMMMASGAHGQSTTLRRACPLPQGLVDLPGPGAFAQFSKESVPVQLQRIENFIREHGEQLRRVWLYYRVQSVQHSFGEAEWAKFCTEARLAAKQPPRRMVDTILRDTLAAHAAESAQPLAEVTFEVFVRCLVQLCILCRTADDGDPSGRVETAIGKQLIPFAPRLDVDSLMVLANDEGVLRVLAHYRDHIRRIFADYCGKPVRDLKDEDRMTLSAAQRLLKDLRVPEGDLPSVLVFHALRVASQRADDDTPQPDGLSSHSFGALVLTAALVKVPNPLVPPFARLAMFLRDMVFSAGGYLARLRLKP